MPLYVIVAKRGYWPLLTREQWEKCMEGVNWDHVDEGTVWNGVVFEPSELYGDVEGYRALVFLFFSHIEDLGLYELPALHCLMMQLERLQARDVPWCPQLEYVDLDREVAVVTMWLGNPTIATKMAERMLNDLHAETFTWVGEAYTVIHAILKATGLSL